MVREYLSGVTLTAALIYRPIIQSGLLSIPFFLSLIASAYIEDSSYDTILGLELEGQTSRLQSLLKVQLQICVITNLWVHASTDFSSSSSGWPIHLQNWYKCYAHELAHSRHLHQYPKEILTLCPLTMSFNFLLVQLSYILANAMLSANGQLYTLHSKWVPVCHVAQQWWLEEVKWSNVKEDYSRDPNMTMHMWHIVSSTKAINLYD